MTRGGRRRDRGRRGLSLLVSHIRCTFLLPASTYFSHPILSPSFLLRPPRTSSPPFFPYSAVLNPIHRVRRRPIAASTRARFERDRLRSRSRCHLQQPESLFSPVRLRDCRCRCYDRDLRASYLGPRLGVYPSTPKTACDFTTPGGRAIRPYSPRGAGRNSKHMASVQNAACTAAHRR